MIKLDLIMHGISYIATPISELKSLEDSADSLCNGQQLHELLVYL